MAKYKRLVDEFTGEFLGIFSPEVGTFPEDPNNMDYQDYLEWIEEGNTPD